MAWIHMGDQMILWCPQGRIDETLQEQNKNIPERGCIAVR